MNLGRIGHYFVPTVTSGDIEAGQDLAGSCRTALVVAAIAHDDAPEGVSETVGLAVWNHKGGPETRLSVPVETLPGVGHDSFHLSTDCPWRR